MQAPETGMRPDEGRSELRKGTMGAELPRARKLPPPTPPSPPSPGSPPDWSNFNGWGLITALALSLLSGHWKSISVLGSGSVTFSLHITCSVPCKLSLHLHHLHHCARAACTQVCTNRDAEPWEVGKSTSHRGFAHCPAWRHMSCPGGDSGVQRSLGQLPWPLRLQQIYCLAAVAWPACKRDTLLSMQLLNFLGAATPRTLPAVSCCTMSQIVSACRSFQSGR